MNIHITFFYITLFQAVKAASDTESDEAHQTLSGHCAMTLESKHHSVFINLSVN
jgi:hypothetical protein